MHKILLLLLVVVVATSCEQKTDSAAKTTASFTYDSSYKEAIFEDAARVEKIKKAMPAVDSMFRRYADRHHLPGVAYGIVVDGELIHTGNLGYTDIDKKTPVTSQSLFRIASMSKSFTAMAILKLRDDGKLDLDDPVSDFVPEMKDQRYPTADAPLITVRHLLTHGAGFPEDNPWGDRQLADNDSAFRKFLNEKISFSTTPATAFEYSNLGFALLGKIVTRVSGKPYQQYIREAIWQPLGMNTSEWEYGNIDPAKLAHGYRWLNEKWNEEALLHDTPDGSWGAMGSMISSVEEFSRYMGLHLRAWPPSNKEDNGPVKRSSVREMHHPWRFTGTNLNYRYPDGRVCAFSSAYCYGLAWAQDCDGKVQISHSGGLPGFGSQWRIMPDYGIGIVSFANRTYSPMGGINLHVLDTIVKLAELKPRVLPPSRILAQRQQELVKFLPDWTNADKSDVFAENFFFDYPIDSLKKNAQRLYEKAGNIIAIKPLMPDNQLRGEFTIDGEKTDLQVYFTLSPENPGRIQEYEIWELVPPKK